MPEPTTFNIIHRLLQGYTIPNELLNDLQQKISCRQVKKGQVLQRKGDAVLHNYYVVKGCLRSYTIDEKGKEHIFMFAPEGWIIGDIESQVKNGPGELYIDAIEDTELEIFEKELFTDVMNIPKAAEINYSRLLRRISVLQRRIIMLMSATAQERYEDFIATYPDIMQRVPQKMIASYLGITPEALSKIRGRMARHK